MRLDQHRTSIIVACLRSACNAYTQKAQIERQQMRFAEANRATEFAKACLMIADEFDREAKKGRGGIILTS